MFIRWIHIIIALLTGSIPVAGQYFENPSFEGIPGISVPPPSWQPFGENSTPDTEPLACDSYLASHGETYLTLVARGSDHEIPNSVESAITSLLQPLEEGSYYRLTIDLASRKDVGHFSWIDGFVAYTNPVQLSIFGSTDGLDREELLAESVAVSNEQWSSYSFILFPGSDVSYLILETQLTGDSAGSGNLLLDHLSMEEIDEPPLEFGDLVVPNVFTPNNDGINDEFTIRGLANGTYLLVFDRTGREVFESTSYENDWNGQDKSGRDLPPGTYWYILFQSDMSETTKGFVYLKREL